MQSLPTAGTRRAATRAGAAAVLGAALATGTAGAQEVWNPFAQGRFRLSILAGGGVAGGETYAVLGAGGAYYLLDGLEVGLDADAWFLGDPTIVNLSPQTRYVFHAVPTLKPYVGAFYRHAFITGFDDQDSIGGRAGFFYVPGRGAFVGGGFVYERWLACDDTSFRACNAFYPELVFAFVF